MPSDTVAGPPPSKVRAAQPDALFRAVADQAPQVMWIVNAKGAVTYLNHAWYELVGGMPPQWHGHEWGEVVHPDDLAAMRAQWEVASALGSIFEGQRRVKARDGRWHTLSFRATPVFDEQGLACWVGMDADITEMVASQTALRAANVQLETFSHAVFHDLKAPLVTAKGFAMQLAKLLAGERDARVSNYLARLTQSVDRMGNLLDGLSLLADVSRSTLDLQDVDLSKMAEDILDALARGHPDRRVATSVQPGLVVRADGRLMAVLLENLLANAWKFTSRREDAQIGVGLASQTRAESVYFVKDNGAGFDMAHAAKLFTAFERLHTTAEFPGSGIGLASVHKVVARHGGRAWAESAPGRGACFYVALPAPAGPESR